MISEKLASNMEHNTREKEAFKYLASTLWHIQTL